MSFVDKFWTKTNEIKGAAMSAMNSASSALSNMSGLGVGSNLQIATSSGVAGGSTDPYLTNRKYTTRIFQDTTCVVGSVPESVEINQSAQWNAPWAGGIAGAKGDLLAVGLGTRLVAQVLTLKVWQGGGNNDFDFSVQFELRAYSDANRDVMIPLRALLAMNTPSLSANGFLKAPGPQLNQAGMRSIGAGVVSGAVATVEVATDMAKKGFDALTSKSSMTDASVTSISDAGAGAVNKIGAAVQGAGLTRRAIEANMDHKISVEIGDWFRMSNVIITDVRHTLKAQRPGPDDGTLMAADVVVSFSPMFTVTREDIDMIIGSQLRPAGQRKGM